MVTKTTEREVSAWLSEQINGFLAEGGYPFAESTVETSLSGTTSRFPDIIIWHDRKAKDPFAVIEIKPPDSRENVDRLKEVGERLKVKYLLTWNFNLAVLYSYEIILTPKKEYPTYALSCLEDYLRTDIRIRLRKHIQTFLRDFKELHEKGHTHDFSPDKYFFIKLLQDSTDTLHGYFTEHLRKKRMEKKYRTIIDEFLVEQGILEMDSGKAAELVGRQWVYGLITKLLFYLTIRREFPDLPDIIRDSQDSKSLHKLVFGAFEKAAGYDWHAVFEPDSHLEVIGIPPACDDVLRDLLGRLGEYRFDNLKEDVIGEIFESLIPEPQKHRLGQYFTREDLVDLILGFVVKSPQGYYCDPTCGSGTFLNRLYARIQWLSHNQKRHHDILSQIWGFDIAKFPAGLATINLFRQDVSNFRNFPHVLKRDFFEVRPGQVFQFPPAQTSGAEFYRVDVKLPEFSGLVGNFPFIRQEQIEKKIKGYRDRLIHHLAMDWIRDHPDLFKTKSNGSEVKEINGYEGDKFSTTIKGMISRKALDLKLSGQADIYAYLYLHGARLLEKDGRMGFITSNSYLDVGYGHELKRFFLGKFKIVAVVASWAEPWFDYAAINTVFTILERCDNAEERDNHYVRFIKLKRKLEELIPYRDLENEDYQRWNHIDTLVRRLELSRPDSEASLSEMKTVETDDFRIRLVKQEHLLREISGQGQHAKWGAYLRAPDVYFEILEKAKAFLVPLKDIADIRFGIKTGINDFFYLKPSGLKAYGKKCRHVKNDMGWEGEIEVKFLARVIISPKEADCINIDPKSLKNLLFVCDMSKAELKKAGYLGALKYIEWAEKQKTGEGVKWPDVPSVKNREYWWAIGNRDYYPILMQMINNDRYLVFINGKNTCVDHNLFELRPRETDSDLVAALMNSTFTGLNRELVSRINLGDGATKTEGIDWSHCVLIFDPNKIDDRGKNKILQAFGKLKDRPIEAISSEVKRSDRKNLDTAILEAVGLDSKHYLGPLYKGLVNLVSDRLALPKMRKKAPKAKVDFSMNVVKTQIEAEILEGGLRRFPESFLPKLKKDELESIPITGTSLRVGHHFFGEYEILDENGKLVFAAKSLDMANYIICAREPNSYLISMPRSAIVITKAVKAYARYIRSTYQKLVRRAFSATHDHKMADRIALELLRDHGYEGQFSLSEE